MKEVVDSNFSEWEVKTVGIMIREGEVMVKMESGAASRVVAW